MKAISMLIPAFMPFLPLMRQHARLMAAYRLRRQINPLPVWRVFDDSKVFVYSGGAVYRP